MSLDWNASKVKNWADLTDNERTMANALVWLTMSVGIREIKEDNAKEFHARLQLIESLHGAYMNTGGKPKYIKLEEVERFIGLKTNVTTKTRNQFNKEQLARFYGERGLK